MSQYVHFDLKKIIIFCYFTFHSFSFKKPFYKQRETKRNIPIQFQKVKIKKFQKNIHLICIYIYIYLSYLKNSSSFSWFSFQLFLSPSKKVRNIYFELTIILLLPLSSRWFIGEEEELVNSKRACFARGLMAILFLRECTVECRARTWNRRIKQVRTTMFRIRPTGIYAAGSRVGNYPRHKTIPWNARHAAFRPAHFRYVITSILSSQSRHPRVCLRDLTPSFAANSRPVAAFARPMRLSPINYAPFRPS